MFQQLLDLLCCGTAIFLFGFAVIATGLLLVAMTRGKAQDNHFEEDVE